MKTHVCIAGVFAASVAVAVAAAEPRTSWQSTVQMAANGDVESFYGIPMMLTASGLKRLPYRVVAGQEVGEGDLQTFYMITARQGIKVKVVFRDDGRLYLAQSESSKARGPGGIGVGSSLSEVQAAWPKGKLLYGSEDGRFVTFDTGINLLYNFNPQDMPAAAFVHPRKEVSAPNLRVTRVRIFAR